METFDAPGHPFDGAPVVHQYTRTEAITDGSLVNVTETAREAGLRLPTALTRAVWNDCVEWTEEDRAKSRAIARQDEDGRLWDVLWMAKVNLAMRKKMPITEPLVYSIRRLPRPGRGRTQRVQLKLTITGGDSGEPVITIIEPDED